MAATTPKLRKWSRIEALFRNAPYGVGAASYLAAMGLMLLVYCIVRMT